MEFNREQRRKLKKRLNKSGLSVDTAIELLERRMQALASEALPVGAQVKLDYDAIVNQPNYTKRQQAYKDFVEANKEKEFTVEYDEKHTSGKLVCLAEDTSEQKWLWHAADLIRLDVKKEIDPESATGDVSEEANHDGRTENKSDLISETQVSD